MFAKLINNKLCPVVLPIVLPLDYIILSSVIHGRKIFTLDETLLRQAGYKPVIQNTPSWNHTTLYSLSSSCIIEHYIPCLAVDTTDFDDACVKFKSVCQKIGELLGVLNFRGGFDLMDILSTSSKAETLLGLKLAMQWTAANLYAKYEGSKLGYGQPLWWYRCWGLTP